jgi:hypothetical protein
MPYKDPEKRREYEKKRKERVKSDPVKSERLKQSLKESSKKYWEKIKTDPKLHEEYKERHRELDRKRDRNRPQDKEYRKERWIKIKSDPELHKKHNEVTLIATRKFMENPIKRERKYTQAREIKREIKNKLFEILGGRKCVDCNEEREEVLQFDHIKNNGYEDRKKFYKHPETMRKFYVENPELAKQTFKVRCGNCNLLKRLEHDRVGYKINYETKVYKDKIFQIFDNRCSKCGFNNISCLTLDHRNGEGRKERKSRFGGYYIRFYKYYSEHPEEAKQNLELLCFNCNLVKKHLNGENTYQY